MRFHLLMLIIVVLVSLSMHSMANAAPRRDASSARPISSAPVLAGWLRHLDK